MAFLARCKLFSCHGEHPVLHDRFTGGTGKGLEFLAGLLANFQPLQIGSQGIGMRAMVGAFLEKINNTALQVIMKTTGWPPFMLQWA